MTDPGTQNILFFDGICHLCNASIDFLLSRDRRRRLLFASLQGRNACERLSESDRSSLDTVVLIENGRLWKKSSAILRALILLGGGWGFLGRILWWIPRPLRDLVYDFIARRRILWFGQRATCRLPTPAEKGRLLD